MKSECLRSKVKLVCDFLARKAMFYLPHTPPTPPQLNYFLFLILLFIFNFHPRPHLPYIDPTSTLHGPLHLPYPQLFFPHHILLFSIVLLHHHHHVFYCFPLPPPPPPHFNCFLSTIIELGCQCLKQLICSPLTNPDIFAQPRPTIVNYIHRERICLALQQGRHGRISDSSLKEALSSLDRSQLTCNIYGPAPMIKHVHVSDILHRLNIGDSRITLRKLVVANSFQPYSLRRNPSGN